MTREFEKNIKKLKRSGVKMSYLEHTIEVLITQNAIELSRLHDHALQGKLSMDREIHVGQKSSNWVLRYRIENEMIILLLATGTHGDVLDI